MMIAYIASPVQWLIVILVCLLVFGAKRLPELARLLGRSVGEVCKARRAFEDALHETLREEKKQAEEKKHPRDGE